MVDVSSQLLLCGFLGGHARQDENFVLVSGGGVEVHADSSVLSGVISGSPAHTGGSARVALGYQGRSPWLVGGSFHA